MSRLVIAGSILLLTALAASWWMLGSQAVRTAVVRETEIREFIDELAKTRVPDQYEITMPYAARLERVNLNVGDRVTAGEIVAHVAESDLEQEVAEARAVVERLQASLAENDDQKIEEGAKLQAEKYVEAMVSTLGAAEARIEAGKARLEFSESVLGRIRQLQQSGVATEEELERATMEFEQSRGDYRQQVLIAESLRAIKVATDLLPQIISDYINHKSLKHAVIAREKEEADVRLSRVLLRQKRGALESPVDGVVIDRPIYDEQFLPAGARVIVIGRLDDLEVETDVLTQEATAIKLGDPAETYGPAVGREVGLGLLGTVHRIYPAGFTKISSLGVEQQRVKIVVRFNPGERERLERQPGIDFRVRVRITTAVRALTTVVPRSTLFRAENGDWQLLAVARGRTELRTVELGLLNDRHAEVIQGVRPGEIVVVTPEHSLRPGARVSPGL